jgi:hypothetical protein
MSDTIFKLLGEITVNGLGAVKTGLATVESQFTQAEKAVFKFGRQCTSIGTTLSKDITAPLVALGAAVALTANKTIEFADKLTNLETVTGLSSRSLQEYKYIAEMTDTSFDGFVGTISKFTNKMAGIVSEGGKPYETLKRLGVVTRDLNGHIRDMNELFPETIKALQNIENPIERNQAAMQIFGKSVSDLAPILSLSNKQFDEMRKRANDLGLVMSENDVKAANEFGDEVKKLQVQLNSVINKLGASLIPVLLNTLLPIINEQIVPATKSFAEKIRGVVEWYNKLTPAQQNAIAGFAALIASLGPALLIFGKTVAIFKSLEAAIVVARTAMIALSISMATNPFGIALIGAAAFAGVLATIVALEDKRKTLSVQETKDAGINKELQDFIKLKNEQETIIKMGEGSNFKVYSKESVAQAKANLAIIKAEIIKFNAENGISPTANAPETPKKNTGTASNTEYVKKLKEQNATELQLLEIQRQEAIKNAKLSGETTLEINKYYAEEKRKVQVKLQRELIDSEATKREDEHASMVDLENTRDQIAADETTNLDEKTKRQLSILKRKYDEEIRAAEEASKSTYAIDEKYELNKQKIESDAAKQNKQTTLTWQEKKAQLTTNEVEQNKIQMQRDLAAVKGNEAAQDAIREYYAELEKKRKKNVFQAWLSQASSTLSTLSSLVSQSESNQIQSVENWKTAQLDALDKSTLSTKQKADKEDEINDEADKKERAIKRKSAIYNKAISLAQAVVNGAQSVTAAWALGPVLGAIMAPIVATLCAAQIALIVSQPLPLAEGALIKATSGGTVAQIGEGNDDEIVLPVQKGIKSLSEGIVNKIGSTTTPQGSAASIAGSGSGSGTTYSSTHLHVGVLVADKAGLKELARQLAPIQTSEQQRRGD